MRGRRLILIVLLAAGCGHASLVSDRLYFGRDVRGRSMVSDEEWAAFVKDVVAPKFVDGGWSVYRVDGFWNDRTGLTMEQTFVLERVHRPGAREDSLINLIARSYVQRFNQIAVLRVRSQVVGELIEK